MLANWYSCEMSFGGDKYCFQDIVPAHAFRFTCSSFSAFGCHFHVWVCATGSCRVVIICLLVFSYAHVRGFSFLTLFRFPDLLNGLFPLWFSFYGCEAMVASWHFIFNTNKQIGYPWRASPSASLLSFKACY